VPPDWNIGKNKNFTAQHRNLQIAAYTSKIGRVTWNDGNSVVRRI
jgi:hypothetical protein